MPHWQLLWVWRPKVSAKGYSAECSGVAGAVVARHVTLAITAPIGLATIQVAVVRIVMILAAASKAVARIHADATGAIPVVAVGSVCVACWPVCVAAVVAEAAAVIHAVALTDAVAVVEAAAAMAAVAAAVAAAATVAAMAATAAPVVVVTVVAVVPAVAVAE